MGSKIALHRFEAERIIPVFCSSKSRVIPPNFFKRFFFFKNQNKRLISLTFIIFFNLYAMGDFDMEDS